MSITLKVQPEALKTKASEVESDIRVLERHFNDIQDIVARSAGYWTGIAGERARGEFAAQKESTSKVIRRFREHPTDLLIMAGVYEETERTVTAENEKLATDVIE